ncbi:MAG TPA: serine hydrolase [Candidatus Saccharimonadales bacterium]|jgi:D-alanyl-D-alanine carboxypeptidase (penicillin-binding protein 5/6)|nr:serine hydrolase [Candidatus Saccharimonadales bacterium]
MSKRPRYHWQYGLVLFLLVAYVAWALLRPLPLLKPGNPTLELQLSAGTSVLNWPAVGQSAVGIVGNNILETHNTQKPAPTASTAKIITALTVLKQKPLATGQQGPTVTLGPNDLAIYNTYVAQGGSTVPVQAGEQISEYQMLEAMLLPSANNMADSLAIWAYGSLPAYSAAANAYAQQLGLTGTTIGSDASGYNPSTVSTAQDLVKLGEIVMQNPVLAGIVGQTTASDIPLAPNAKNINLLLGSYGIIGIKTGNTDQAGGVFVGAARTDVNQKPVIIVTALVGAPTLFDSMKFSLPLLQSVQANFQTITPIHANDVLGHYQIPWGKSINVIAAHNLALTTWAGTTLSTRLSLPQINSNSSAGQTVSTLTISDPVTKAKSSVNVTLDSAVPPPTLSWRLEHPLF